MTRQRRKFYRAQCTALGELMYEKGPGDWSVIGPRESDAQVLILHRTPYSSTPYLMTASGVICEPSDMFLLDPVSFGWRGSSAHGKSDGSPTGRRSTESGGTLPSDIPGQLTLSEPE